jgi:2'-5' RNA ligase
MARLFVAVWPPAAVVDELAPLAQGRPGVRPVAARHLHVTLRFLGDADAGAVGARLDAVTFEAATAVLGPAVRRLGQGALVVPVRGLDTLAAAVIEATSDIGEPAGPFRGHLTLGRFRRGTRRDPLLGLRVGGEFRVDEVLLIDSTLGQGGPEYAVVGRWPAR